MKTVLTLVFAALLSHCNPETPPVTIVTPVPPPLAVAPECNPAGDAKWINPPDADVRLTEAIRRDDHNGDVFEDVSDARRVCWASLKGRVRTGETSNQATGPK